MVWRPSALAQMSATIVSVGPSGRIASIETSASGAGAGAGSAARSSLPLGVSGSRSSPTIRAGTM
ncbi:hypothetical protein AIGOOFII_4171 [Methylobacterium marchantiae]|nr:hypothetical protein AIGOOFII_4171 [Methylobacterium marchantiae]